MNAYEPIHDVNAERLLLSCCMLDSDVAVAVKDAFVCDEGNKRPFVDTICATLWNAYLLTEGDVWDLFNVSQHLPSGTIDYNSEMRSMYSYTYNTRSWEEYLAVVKDCYSRRALMLIWARAMDLNVAKKMDIEELLTKVKDSSDKLSVLDSDSGDVNGVDDLNSDVKQRSEAKYTLRSGLVGLDQKMGELYPGDVVLIASRTNVGKSHIAEQIMLNASTDGHPCGCISLEMKPRGHTIRMIANKARINNYNVKKQIYAGTPSPEVAKASIEVGKLPIYYNRKFGMYIDDIEREAKRWKRMYGIKYLFIDHFNLMRTRKDRVRELNEAAERLKTLANELDLVIVELAQLNRQALDRDGNCKPQLHHLKDCGGLEECATHAFILHQPDGIAEMEKKMAEQGYVNLLMIAAKMREGSKFVISGRFYPQYSDFDTHHIEDCDVPD